MGRNGALVVRCAGGAQGQRLRERGKKRDDKKNVLSLETHNREQQYITKHSDRESVGVGDGGQR